VRQQLRDRHVAQRRIHVRCEAGKALRQGVFEAQHALVDQAREQRRRHRRGVGSEMPAVIERDRPVMVQRAHSNGSLRFDAAVDLHQGSDRRQIRAGTRVAQRLLEELLQFGVRVRYRRRGEQQTGSQSPEHAAILRERRRFIDSRASMPLSSAPPAVPALNKLAQ